jgi:dsRNA-specific ribonuclease
MSRENLARKLSKQEIEGLRQEAWIGDAVLELYVREYILKQDASRDDAWRISLVRNSFLNQIGQPTRVEAEIGRQYNKGGLQAAYAWIQEQLEPLIAELSKAKPPSQAPRKKASRG